MNSDVRAEPVRAYYFSSFLDIVLVKIELIYIYIYIWILDSNIFP